MKLKALSFPFPNLINVHIVQNWLYDFSSPEPGVNINAKVHEGDDTDTEFHDAEREASISYTQPHTTHSTFVTFAGRSSRRGPRRRNNPTTSSTSLDEILA